jgi:hypothetical protein
METPFVFGSEDIRVQGVRLAPLVEVPCYSVVLFNTGGITFRCSYLLVGRVHAQLLFIECVKSGPRFGIPAVCLLDDGLKLPRRGTTHAHDRCGVVFGPTLGKVFPRVNLLSREHPFFGKGRFDAL